MPTEIVCLGFTFETDTRLKQFQTAHAKTRLSFCESFILHGMRLSSFFSFLPTTLRKTVGLLHRRTNSRAAFRLVVYINS